MKSGVRHTDPVRPSLDRFREELPETLRLIGRRASARIGAVAAKEFMQDAPAGSRRSPDDGGPIRIVSGRLVRSLVTRGRQEDTGGQPEGIMEIAVEGGVMTLTKGSRVPYARANELGFEGTVQVPAHRRRSPEDDVVADYTRSGKARYLSQGVVFIRAHQRKVRIPARSYLGPAQEASEPYVAGLAQRETRKLIGSLTGGGAA